MKTFEYGVRQRPFLLGYGPLGLGLGLALAALAAACGGPPAPPDVPPTPTAAPEAATPPAATPATVAPAPAPSTTIAAPSGPKTNTAIAASKLLDDVKKSGIDPAKNPSLEKMALADKKKLMPYFVKALGFQDCTGCHASLTDFKTVTRNMQVTRGMWSHFVAMGRDKAGGAMFCDSCHAGSAKILARADRDGVKKFMESDYVGKITRADKKPMECTTCHSDTMELDIFGKVWGVK